MRPLTRHATASRRLRPALVLFAAAALVAVAGCGSAETAALDAQDTPTTEATDEPTDEPTEDEPTEDPTEDPTTPPTTAAPTPTPNPTVASPRFNQCRNLNAIEVRARLSVLPANPVSCASPHNAQTYRVAKLTTAIRNAIGGGNRVQMFSAARRTCELALPGYLGVSDSRQKQSQFDFVIGLPSQSAVQSGATWVRCDVVLKNGQTKVEQLPAQSAQNLLAGKKGDPYLQCIRSSNINIASGTFLCRDAHNWRSVSSIKLGTGAKPWPGTASLTRSVRNRCSTAVRRYLDTSGSFQYGYVLPTQDLWKYGDRWAVCFAKTRN